MFMQDFQRVTYGSAGLLPSLRGVFKRNIDCRAHLMR